MKIDVDPEGPVLAAFEASGVPTYLVFRNGVEVDRLSPLLVDWLTEERLRKKIRAALEPQS